MKYKQYTNLISYSCMIKDIIIQTDDINIKNNINIFQRVALSFAKNSNNRMAVKNYKDILEHIYKNIKSYFRLDRNINSYFISNEKNGMDFGLNEQNDLDVIKTAIKTCKGNKKLYEEIKEIYDKIEYNKLFRVVKNINYINLDYVSLISKDFKPFKLE